MTAQFITDLQSSARFRGRWLVRTSRPTELETNPCRLCNSRLPSRLRCGPEEDVRSVRDHFSQPKRVDFDPIWCRESSLTLLCLAKSSLPFHDLFQMPVIMMSDHYSQQDPDSLS